MFGDDPLDLSAPTSFHTAIRYSSARSIHEATGRAIVIGEDIYYSPNSSKTPPLPPKGIHSYVCDPLKDSVQEFHNPHWWTIEAGYLPFLPISPNFHNPPFLLLFNIPIHTGKRPKRRVQMDSNDILNWNHLEHTLAKIFKSFQASYSIPDMPPIICTSVACQKEFEFPSQFVAAEKRCRNWFSLWMAMASLGIAIAEISDGHREADMVPKWYRDFTRHTDEPTLSEIRQQLGQFPATFPRAGVFLDLNSAEDQPTVDFFVHLGIPVWYPWGSKEEHHAHRNPSFWKKYVPPSHLLQQVQSFLVGAPTLAPPAESDEDRPWVTFFQERQRRATGSLPKNKPNLRVYHWEKDFSSGKWTRTPIVRRFNAETLAEYGKNQKHYDEQSNEWDVATEMGEKDAEELQADYWENSDDEPILPIGIPPMPLKAAPPTINYISDKTLSSTTTLRNGPAQREDYYPDEHSPADILRLFFGFVAPPPSVRLVLPPTTEQQIKDFALGIGVVAKEVIQEFAQTPVGKCAAHFFWNISQTPWVPPPNVLFDLATGNPQSLKHCRRLKFLRQLPGNAYLFDFRGESTVEWKICVDDVSLAFMILRMDNALCDYDIAWALLNQGSPFRTMLYVPQFAIQTAPMGIPRLRFSDYKFGVADYESYCHERDNILCNVRVARQALKHGGILWRLAMDNASFQGVLAGPTIDATIQHRCLSVVTGPESFWIDDVLDTREMEVISGVYHVYTGNTLAYQLFMHNLTLLSQDKVNSYQQNPGGPLSTFGTPLCGSNSGAGAQKIGTLNAFKS